jgi:hypothetical protein
MFTMYDRIVFIEYDNSAREHARERTIHDLNTVILAKARVSNS